MHLAKPERRHLAAQPGEQRGDRLPVAQPTGELLVVETSHAAAANG